MPATEGPGHPILAADPQHPLFEVERIAAAVAGALQHQSGGLRAVAAGRQIIVAQHEAEAGGDLDAALPDHLTKDDGFVFTLALAGGFPVLAAGRGERWYRIHALAVARAA